MKYDIKVPSMGESISEATVSAIIKPTGSNVSMDDEILELETDKVNHVLHAPHGGVITLTVKEQDVVKVGQVIGHVDGDLAAPAKASEVKAPAAAAPAPKVEPARQVAAAPAKPQPQQQPAQPSGESSRITKDVWLADLKAPAKGAAEMPPLPAVFKERPPAPPKGERTETRTKMSKIRRLIAARLVEVQQTTAMLTTFNEVDMTGIMALRERYKDSFSKEHGVKLGFMSFFVKACASALEVFPELNSYIDGEDIVHREYIDIGIAVGTDRGLIVPVVRNCDQLTFAQIEQGIEGYAKKAREGGLAVDDLQGGGFTITNGGVYGSLLSTPIINPPQCAILGMHKIMKRPVVVDDQIVIRQMMYLALSYDHRIIDGKQAVSFLVHVKNCLEDPARLLLEV